jgi:hypothetical protein
MARILAPVRPERIRDSLHAHCGFPAANASSREAMSVPMHGRGTLRHSLRARRPRGLPRLPARGARRRGRGRVDGRPRRARDARDRRQPKGDHLPVRRRVRRPRQHGTPSDGHQLAGRPVWRRGAACRRRARRRPATRPARRGLRPELVFQFTLGEGATWRIMATRPASESGVAFGTPGAEVRVEVLSRRSAGAAGRAKLARDIRSVRAH